LTHFVDSVINVDRMNENLFEPACDVLSELGGPVVKTGIQLLKSEEGIALQKRCEDGEIDEAEFAKLFRSLIFVKLHA